MKTFNSYIVYADESGTDNLEKIQENDRYFVLAFCVFDKNYYLKELTPSFQKLKFDTFGYDQVIIHGYDMMKQKGDFKCLEDEIIRNNFFRRTKQYY